MPASVRSLPPPSKKRKLQEDPEVARFIQRLENELIDAVNSHRSLNLLADLLNVALTSKTPQDTSKAIYALYRVFVIIITKNYLSLDGDDAAKVVKAWIWERINSYVEFLGGLLKDEEKILRISALQILFSLQKHLSTMYSKTSPQFHISHFRKVVSYLLLCPPSPMSNAPGTRDIDLDVLHEFYEKWFSVYDDVRWFFLREATTLLNSTSQTSTHLAENILSILERLNTFPTEQVELNAWWVAELGVKPPKPKHTKKSSAETASSSDEDEGKEADDDDDNDDWRKFFDEEPMKADPSKPKPAGARLNKLTIHQSLHSLSSHRAVFTRAWLSLLPQLSLASDAEKRKTLVTRALNGMYRGVIPHLTRPVLIMDWIGECVDFGGAVGLLALNALFVLIKEYNLDYPSFYTRLYTFLDRDVLHVKHRARFFRLTELFLSSTHLPANLLASFIKRLSRLSLTAPPAAIIMIIPFTYNILKRHPALMTMIHRIDVDDPSNDPFLPLEPDPLQTQAHLSSLWELMSHGSHYHSGVSTLIKIFSEAFTKPGYAMEDFLDHTYGTLFDTEANRKIKKEPALAMELGKVEGLFPVVTDKEPAPEGLSQAMHTDVISELWTFG